MTTIRRIILFLAVCPAALFLRRGSMRTMLQSLLLLLVVLCLAPLWGQGWTADLDYEILRYRPEPGPDQAALLRRMLVRDDSILVAVQARLRQVEPESQRQRVLLQDEAALLANLDRIRSALGGLELIERWHVSVLELQADGGSGRIDLSTPLRSIHVDLDAGLVRAVTGPEQERPLPPPPEPLPAGKPLGDASRLRELQVDGMRLRYRPDLPNPFAWTRAEEAAAVPAPMRVLARSPGLPVELHVPVPEAGWQAWRLLNDRPD